MNALQESVEVQTCAAADDNFSIEHEFARGQGAQRGHDFREITRERLTRLGLQNNFIARAKSQTAEAVPLGLVEPTRFVRQLFYRLGFSRRIRRLKREIEFGKPVIEGLSGNGGGVG